MCKQMISVLIFGAFLILILVIGFFLWQSLFSNTAPSVSDENEDTIATYTKWLAIFNALLVLATIGLFVSGERTVGAARKAAQAAQQSADVAKDTLIAAHRPWISVQIIPTGRITWGAGGMQISYKIILKNIGKSPAFDVRHIETVIVDRDANIPATETGLLPLLEISNGLTTANIMPEDNREMIVHYQVPKADIDKSAKSWVDNKGPKLIVPVLVGVVEYRTQFDSKIHHSDFIYEIGFWDGDKGITVTALDPSKDGEIPSDFIRIRRHAMVDGQVN